jgi:hypothetical protein
MCLERRSLRGMIKCKRAEQARLGMRGVMGNKGGKKLKKKLIRERRTF